VIPRLALLGVDDKGGLVEFAQGLHRHSVQLVATGGTEAALRAASLPVVPIAEVTGMAEMLDGRVKTLHPAIHAGILARREDPSHLATLAEHHFRPIDMVVVNLYPFVTEAAAGHSLDQVVEAIDIGGPTLLRAAAKNWRSVAAVSSPEQYSEILRELDRGDISEEVLSRLAVRAFELTSSYDALIAADLRVRMGVGDSGLRAQVAVPGLLRQRLRYGENPHQTGAIYSGSCVPRGLAAAQQIQGGELSYTNWLDADSAWRTATSLQAPGAVVVKHTNPCGAAEAETTLLAFERAYSCDTRSAYGGVVGLNQPLDLATAEALAGHFLELVVAPSVTEEAAARLSGRPRLRVLVVGDSPSQSTLEVRSIDGGLLIQTTDRGADPEESFTVVSQRPPTSLEWGQLRLAWQVVRGVKSNAIVLCREGMAVGIGAGQMSRVEAVQLAVARAGDRSAGSCLASDAFFPMADGLELAAESGVTAAIHPGGSIRDIEVIAAADRAGVALVATGVRHFRH